MIADKPRPLFMSQEHVDVMNVLLRDDPVVRAACAELSEPRSLGYRLADGPNGEIVHWHIAFAPTVEFSLADKPADVLFVGDWAQMVRAASAGRDGHSIDPGVTVRDDNGVLSQLAPILEQARAVATVPVDFPEV